MKRITFAYYAILMLTLAGAMFGQQQTLTLADIFDSDIFRGNTIKYVQWLNDGRVFFFGRKNSHIAELDVYRHEVENGEESLILESGMLTDRGEPLKISEFQINGREDILLIIGEKQKIWRHSFKAPHYIYYSREKRLVPLAGNDSTLQNVFLSPDGKSVAYVKGNNLYLTKVASGQEKQLTRDGSANILNGVFDWVYEEEFGRADAYRWSPDGQKIAFWRTDQTRVKTMPLLDEIPHYPIIHSLKYPKAGEQNALVKIGVVDIATSNTTWMDLGENDDIYIPRIDWSNSSDLLAIQRLNRRQNTLELLLAEVASGKIRHVTTDTNEAWVDVTDDVKFLSRKDQFVWTSEKSGFRHIYLSDYDGRQIAQLTAGDWEVSEVLSIDEQGGWVYFLGKKDSPLQEHLYRAALDGKKLEKISREPGWHDAEISPTGEYYVGFFSDVRTPTRVSLRTAEGEMLKMIEKNEITALSEYRMVYPEFIRFTTSDGVELNAYFIKPANFNPQKKYPLIVFGYGGPGSQRVINRWGMGSQFRHLQQVLWHQFMTENGYLIFCVDNRGTGGRGKAFKNLAYGDISKWAVHDQIEGARYLATLPYVDSSRIGFWGWSGGGYLSCMLITRGSDYFSTAVAVASVTDFRNYDTIWTERYMGLPEENQSGYQAANVLHYTEQLQGKLLLIHGSGDDNVHPQNTIQFANELIAHNKRFELMLYPNRNHRIHGGNTSLHLHTLIANYFLENL